MSDLHPFDKAIHELDQNPDFREKIRNDYFLYTAYNIGVRNDLSEIEVLKMAVIALLDIKDKAFQNALDEAMKSPIQSIM